MNTNKIKREVKSGFAILKDKSISPETKNNKFYELLQNIESLINDTR